MNKALHEVEERVKLVDVVIELLDARAPLSSVNEQLEKVIQNKKKLIVLSKPDLADPAQTDKWKAYEKEFAEAGIRIVYFPYTKGISSTKINAALENLQPTPEQKKGEKK